MYTYLAGSAVAFAVFVSVASAQSIVPSYSSATLAAPQSYCPSLSYNLYRGLSDYYTGGQVSQLQQFLALRGYYQPVTGYFGSVTASNVARFQQEQGVYPITGGVGPLTRAAIARVCGGYTPTPAPASVTVSSPSHGSSYSSGQTMPIIWSTNYQPYLPSYSAYPNYTANIDLYQANGTLVGAIAMGAQMSGSHYWSVPTAGTICTMQYPNGLCGQALSGQYFIKVSILSAGTTVATGNSGTVTINTQTQQSASLSASPSSGTAPLGVTMTVQVYEGGTYTLDWGDGTSEALNVPSIYCITAPCYPPAFTRSHTYQTQGTYTARLIGYQGTVLATRVVTVSAGTQQNATLGAYPVYGSAPLVTTFTIQVQNGGTYTLNYGDGSSEELNVPSPSCAPGGQCSIPSFTRSHTYQAQGVYTARLMTYQGVPLATQTISVSGSCGPYWWYGCQ